MNFSNDRWGSIAPRRSANVPLVGKRLVRALLATALATGTAQAQGTTAIVSRSSHGLVGNGDSGFPSLSSDGRYIAFHSDAWQLVPGDTNYVRDVFVLDRSTGVVERVSVTSAGGQVFADSDGAAISADGRFVGFQSLANDLAGGTAGTWDVFVHDRTTGTTELVSVASNGTPADDYAYVASLSADGRFVGFESAATNLDPAATATLNVYRRDRLLGVTQTVNAFANGACGGGWISGDGNRVCFASIASNLVAGDTNGRWDVFVRDFQTGTIERASVSLTGGNPDADSDGFVRISLDGRFVSFTSEATNLVAGFTTGNMDVYLRDLAADTTQLVSVAFDGGTSNGANYESAVSADGRRVAFQSQASNILSGVAGGVFVRDMSSGVTRLASCASDGTPGNNGSWSPALSGDGRYAGFCSVSSNLVEPDTYQLAQVYVHDLEGCEPIVAETCQGGTTSHGCAPLLGASGTPSGSAGSGFVLTANGLEGGRSALVFYALGGGKPTPWGNTFRCTSGTTQRAVVTHTGGTPGACDGTVSFDWNQYVATHPSALGAPFGGGETVSVQVWFRDPSAPLASNLSSSVWFDVCP
ncbi:MAG: PD40 domain-containing protein [Planctomycetes bacterium]|nr:PD40 domain-containing protein [Planctomycetota bacterium]